WHGRSRGARDAVQVRAAEVEARRHDPRLVLRHQERVLTTYLARMHPGQHARTMPDKPAVVMAGTGEIVTYGELDERSIRHARVWREAGLRRGDHVALLADNAARYLEVYWAAIRSGLYLTAVNRYLSAD